MKTLLLTIGILLFSCAQRNPLVVERVKHKSTDIDGWYEYTIASGTPAFYGYKQFKFVTQETFEVGDTLKLVKK